MKPPFEAYTGNGPFIFVCYAHKDKELVYPELTWLREQGFNIWYDEGISPGEEWPERLAWAIEKADKVLFYASPNSVQSRVCRNEVNLAVSENKKIFVVQVKPTELSGGLKLALGSEQAIVRDQYQTADEYKHRLKSFLEGSTPQTFVREKKKVRFSAIPALVIVLLAIGISAVYLPTSLRNNEDASDIGPALGPIRASIAVLPLRDMSADNDLDYLGEGLAEELIHGLAQVPGINVLARTSSFYFKDQDLDIQSIGNRLGVETILEGSVRKAGDQIRITLQLINVEDGFHIWSRQYDGLMSDIFSLQDEIAQNVVSAVFPEVDGDAYSDLTNVGTENALAYEAFLIGTYERTQQTRDSTDRAIEQFQLAIERDPKFLRAYEALIDMYDFKGYYYGNREELLAVAAEVLEMAKQHDPVPSNPRWFWMEQLVRNGERVPLYFPQAEELFNLSIRDTSHPINGGNEVTGYYRYGLLLAKSGLFEAALAYLLPLELIDPMSINIKLRLAQTLVAQYDYQAALVKYDDLLEISPRYVQAELDRYLIYGKLGLLSEAETVRTGLAEVFPADLTRLLDSYMLFWAGDTEAAIASVDDLAYSPEIPPNYVGITYLAFGKIEEAFTFFEAAAQEGDPYVGELLLTQAKILSEEQWQNVQQSSEFQLFMSQYGYDSLWPAELANRANAITEYTRVVVRPGA